MIDTPLVHLLILMGALLIAAGCAHPLNAAVATANVAATALEAAHTDITARRKADQLAAARRVPGDRSDPSVRAEQLDRALDVGRRYRTAWDAYDEARAGWLVVAAAIRAAQHVEAAGGELDMGEVVALLAVLAELQRTLVHVVEEVSSHGH